MAVVAEKTDGWGSLGSPFLRLAHDADTVSTALDSAPLEMPDPATIAPRQWLYGTFLLRGYVSVIISPGGVGKTSLTLHIAASLALGRGLLGQWVHARCNVLLCSLEDPAVELDRRWAAMMLHHRLDRTELYGRVHAMHGRARRLVLGKLDLDGMSVLSPDKDAMIELIRRDQIDVLIIDPVLRSHQVDENSNPQIDSLMATYAEIAEATGCAILLVHHTRKGAVAGDAEGGRGAKTMTDGSRAAITLTPMLDEDAKALSVSPRERRRYVRQDDAKQNLAPPAEAASWLRLMSVPLGNATPDYPNGDDIQALERWEPPPLWTAIPIRVIHLVLNEIAKGPAEGKLYRPTRHGGGTAWAGTVVMQLMGVSDEIAKRMLRTWISSGLLYEIEQTGSSHRHKVSGLAVNPELYPQSDYSEPPWD